MASRHTVQRDIVEGEVKRLANHPTADQVYDAVHAEHPNISKATVYRLLGKLSDEGEIARVKINNGADHFDHQTFPHYHVRCTVCGKVDDVMIDQIDVLDGEAAEASGYSITGLTLQFDGICPACQAAQAAAAQAAAAQVPA